MTPRGAALQGNMMVLWLDYAHKREEVPTLTGVDNETIQSCPGYFQISVSYASSCYNSSISGFH